jgi:hypothetical protein
MNGVTIVDTGKRFKLPGHPASMGMSKQQRQIVPVRHSSG